ncbi:MAG: RNA polymerase sigma factor RpoH [Rickettsiales bacterium]
MTSMSLPVLASDSTLRQYLIEIRKFPVLQADEEYMLAKRWVEHGDYEAAHTLVTSHLRLVAKLAMGYRGYGLPVSELVAEGNIGLMQAVKRFDPEKGFRLSTYAMWWIRAAIQEFVLRSWSLVKVGTSAAQKRLFFNLKRLKKQINAIDGRDLTAEEVKMIAKELDVSEDDVIAIDRRMMAHDQHLNAKIGEDGDQEMMDLLPSEELNPEEAFSEQEERTSRRSLLKKALSKLTARERNIIEERRLNDNPKTLEELSQTYNISRERVRQIEARAMEKLTASMAGGAA